MKIKNGIIKNINTKLLAGTLVLTLLTTGLAGCTSIEDIKYTKNESGYIQGIDGTVSYETLKSCDFYKVKNNIIQEEYYTILLYDFNFWDKNRLYDVFTKQDLTEGNFNFEAIDRVENYLISFNMVKEEYTEEDLKEILNKFIEIQEKENNKQLVKE